MLFRSRECSIRAGSPSGRCLPSDPVTHEELADRNGEFHDISHGIRLLLMGSWDDIEAARRVYLSLLLLDLRRNEGESCCHA